MPTTKFIWDDDNYLAEADGSNAINTVYTNEPQQYGNLVSSRISGTTSYHHFDALGSTRQLTNAAGATTDTIIYDAWGNVANRSGTANANLLWIGEVGYYGDAETGLAYIRERVYAPALSRWSALDPLFFETLTRYGYAANNPTLARDPSGQKISLESEVQKGWSHALCGGFKVIVNTTLTRDTTDPPLILIQKIYIWGVIRICDKDPLAGCVVPPCDKIICKEVLATCVLWEVMALMGPKDVSVTSKDTVGMAISSRKDDCPNTSGMMATSHDVRVYQMTAAALGEIKSWPRPSIFCHGRLIGTGGRAFQGKTDPKFTTTKILAEGGYEISVKWNCCNKADQTLSAASAFGGKLKGAFTDSKPSGSDGPVERPTDGEC